MSKIVNIPRTAEDPVDGPASSTDNGIARFDGTDGQSVQSSGVAIDDSDNITLPAGQTVARTATAITYTALVTDYIIAVTSTAAARTIDLPAVSVAGAGKLYYVKDESGAAGTNNITIDPNGAELIDGAATAVINSNYGAMTIYCSGTAWFII